ncbi:MAG: putative polymerase ECF-subfamily sigma factor [Actinomycetia bacterium]|nr:putative polymerase ECF-subfamily sigma factor [Actinomycetes bacterium]
MSHDADSLAELFERHRTHLRAVAHRMLGSLPEADDAVQEAWVKFAAAGIDGVENAGGWLTTIITRTCLNVLRARASRPEQPAGVHVPDPIVTRADDAARDPEQEALLADSVGLALLVVLDTLTPAERVAFVLHDVFDVPFQAIGQLIERSEQASRQLASRARRQVREAGPSVPDVSPAEQRAVTDAFFAAARAGDFDRLVELLDPDVVVRADGGKPARSLVMRGAAEVARAVLATANPRATFTPVLVNGVSGMLITVKGRPVSLMAVTVAGGRITAMDGITDLNRLATLDLPAA